MSGDVQPRKRKDKKKKKDIIEEAVIQHPTTAPIPQPSDDINIHVYKETTTGGGICAKCVFFILMIGIGGLIGFLITEHRGQTDLDIAKGDSRFAQIFEGWVDKSHDDHGGDHSDEVTFDDDHEENASEEHEASEEQDASEEQEASDEREESEEDETSEPDEDEVSEEEEIDDEQIEEEQNDSDDVEQSEEQVHYDDDDEEEVEAEESEEQEVETDASEERNEDSDEKVDAETIKDDDDDDDDDNEKAESEEKGDEKEEGEKQQPELTTTAVAVKVGVGVALFVVAYVVLVRKWKSDKISDKPAKEAEMPDYSRRNTIVPPPTLEEVEQDIENVEEEYSEDEDEESDDAKVHIPVAKKNYQELRSRYSRSLTPESEQEVQGKSEEYEEDDEEYDEEGDDRELISDEDEDIDEDLMQKLEAKYGKLNREKHYEEEEDGDNEEFDSWKRVKVLPDDGAESESDDEKNEPRKRSGAQSLYEFDNITNANDYNIKDDLDNAHKRLSDNVPLALSLFDQILDKRPYSPRGLFGKAHALDLLAEKKRSNDLLQESIKFYLFVLQEKDVPDALFLAAAERSINRMRFVGNYGKAVTVHKMLITRFPNDVKFRNQLAVTYLTTNRISNARLLLLETLQKWPDDGFALVHYGFILKTTDNDLTRAIDYLKKGINTKDVGVIDGRFYFHLGDALARLGRTEEAMKVYEDGVENKVFLSKYQRSLYNIDRLTGRPWWKQHQTPYKQLYDKLEQNWKEIRNEGLSILNKKGYFKDESENLKDTGDWKQFELFARGNKNVENCKKCPITCDIIDKTPDVKSCKRGQVKFSVMHPGTHVWPHCGPTNCRLRVHLGLKVPANTFIRVAEETRIWEDGKVIIFDDSFEHEVWHNGTGFRLVLIVDVWHPELTQKEKQTLSAI